MQVSGEGGQVIVLPHLSSQVDHLGSFVIERELDARACVDVLDGEGLRQVGLGMREHRMEVAAGSNGTFTKPQALYL